jgi:micrococcal nuclease
MKKNFGPKIHPTMELFIVILFLFSEALTAQSFTIPREHYYYQIKVKVDSVIDGDTFVISDPPIDVAGLPIGKAGLPIGEAGSTYVRLLGVDTPELLMKTIEDTLFADSAASFLKNLIEGKTIKLTFDRNLYGIFGRLLAYAWLTDIHDKDSLFIQAELLKAGLARIFYYPKGMKYYYIFQNLKRTARRKRLGIWGIR